MDHGAEFRVHRLPADEASGSDSGLDTSELNTTPLGGFASGTRIKTLRGEIRADDLRRGDRVLTRDNGYQIVRWIGQIDLNDIARRPVRLRKGALGRGVPDRGLLAGPDQQLLIGAARFSDITGPPEALIAASDLTCLAGITTQGHPFDALVQILFDRQELILANGAWCASLRPTRATLAALSPLDRHRLAIRLTEMGKQGCDYSPARPQPDKAAIHKGLIPVRHACPTWGGDGQVTRDRT